MNAPRCFEALIPTMKTFYVLCMLAVSSFFIWTQPSSLNNTWVLNVHYSILPLALFFLYYGTVRIVRN